MANTTFTGPVISTNGFQGTVTTTGNISATGTANVIVIPTADPGVAGAIWLDGVTLSISLG
jgi:hypothetical protein